MRICNVDQMRIAVLNLIMRTMRSDLAFPQLDVNLERKGIRAEYPMAVLVADELARMGNTVDVFGGSIYEVVRDPIENGDHANVVSERLSFKTLFPPSYYPYAKGLPQRLRQGGYDAVLSSEFVQPATVQAMRHKQGGSRLFVWQEIASHPRFPAGIASRILFHRMKANGFQRFDKAIPRSTTALEFLKSQGFPDKMIAPIVPNAVDCRTFKPRGKPDFFEKRNIHDAPRPRIIMAARISRAKGVETFLEATKIVLAEAKSVSFVLKGSGPDLPRVRFMAQKMGLGKNLTVIEEFLPRKDLAELIASCDICAAPSSSDLLFFVPLEAIASGVPVITSTASHHSATFADGKTGMVVPANDSKALASAFLELIHDERRLTAMSKAARQLAVTKFSSEKVARDLLDIFSGN